MFVKYVHTGHKINITPGSIDVDARPRTDVHGRSAWVGVRFWRIGILWLAEKESQFLVPIILHTALFSVGDSDGQLNKALKSNCVIVSREMQPYRMLQSLAVGWLTESVHSIC